MESDALCSTLMLLRERKIGSMLILNTLILLGASFLGGILNSVAGSGSFLTFPALISPGMPPIPANATSTTSL
jgi:uncharacterized membrane protein YfcA